jgi:hypothetical protein
VYSLDAAAYLAAMSRLPNRVYYQQLNLMTDDQMSKTVYNVLTYAGLELLSFVLLTVVLTKLLKFSSFSILGFALQHQWLMAVIQLTLEHFGTVVFPSLHSRVGVNRRLDCPGNDYTFQFKWLGHS